MFSALVGRWSRVWECSAFFSDKTLKADDLAAEKLDNDVMLEKEPSHLGGQPGNIPTQKLVGGVRPVNRPELAGKWSAGPSSVMLLACATQDKEKDQLRGKVDLPVASSMTIGASGLEVFLGRLQWRSASARSSVLRALVGAGQTARVSPSGSCSSFSRQRWSVRSLRRSTAALAGLSNFFGHRGIDF